jgi:hypothetical protein
VTGMDETTRQLIDRYFALAPVGGDAYFAQFADDVVVEDEGKLRHGIGEVRAWRTEVPPVTYTVREVTEDDGAYAAVAAIAGDFPSSPVDLRFGFRFGPDGRITELTIRP